LDIELLATTAVKKSISTTDVLSAKISENDKEPIWDGNIYVYSQKGYRNKHFSGRVPVQVKGQACKRLKNKMNYRIGILELKSYLSDGGVIYFVVSIDRNGQTNIFYKCLLPFELKKVINSTDNQSIKIQFEQFPHANPDKVDIFYNFLNDQELQSGYKGVNKEYTLQELAEMNVLESIQIGFVSTQEKYLRDPDEYLLSKPTTLYASLKTGNTIPLHMGTIETATHTIKKEITCNGNKYFDSYKVEKTRKYTKLIFGKYVSTTVLNGERKATIDVLFPSLLYERIKTTKFILDILKCKYIGIQNDQLDLSGINDTNDPLFDLENLNKELSYFNDIADALTHMGLNTDIDLDSVSKSEYKNLEWLVNHTTKGHPLDNNSKMQLIGNLKIGNIALTYVLKRNSTGQLMPHNFYKTDFPIVAINEDDIKVPVSQFLILKKNDFKVISNIDYEAIVEDICNFSASSELYDKTNPLILEMLSAYDETGRKNNALIECATRLSTWLLNENADFDSTIRQINYLQCLKRTQQLTNEQTNLLYSIIENGSNKHDIYTAAHILLDNFDRAEEHFKLMNKEDQDLFLSYPISNLWCSKLDLTSSQ